MLGTATEAALRGLANREPGLATARTNLNASIELLEAGQDFVSLTTTTSIALETIITTDTLGRTTAPANLYNIGNLREGI